jgi:hypothetical protein
MSWAQIFGAFRGARLTVSTTAEDPMHPALAAICAVLTCTGAAQAHAQGLPRPGLWNLTSSTTGPSAQAETARGQACLHADALHQAPEQTLLDAAPAAAGGRKPRCAVGEVRREVPRTQWTGSCTGPLGTMPAQGEGTLEAERIELRQAVQAKTPLGQRTLQQSLAGQWAGSC